MTHEKGSLRTDGTGRQGFSPPLTVVGMGETGCQGLSSRAFNAVTAADVLVGAPRFLDFFTDFHGQTIPMGEGGLKLKEVLEKIRGFVPEKRVVVLASGDPLFFGIGALLVREFPGAEILPHPSCVQLAAARLGWRTEDLAVWSYHGRPVRDLCHRLRYVERAAILTDQEASPQRLAQLLLEAVVGQPPGGQAVGLWPFWKCWVAESLGGVDEQVRAFSLDELAAVTVPFASLNILLVERCFEDPGAFRKGVVSCHQDHLQSDSPVDQVSSERAPSAKPPRGDSPVGELPMVFPYLPEEAFARRMPKAGLITKREVRLLSLAALGLRPGGVLWDLGAGSGSVGIEALLMARDLRVFAVECDPECVALCEFNARQMGLDLQGSYRVVPGMAPDVCEGLPDPDHVFVGGSKGRLQDIMARSFERLKPGGRLVVNAITLDNVQEAYQGFSHLGAVPELSVVNISRGVPLAGRYLRYEALNPVHIFWTTKK